MLIVLKALKALDRNSESFVRCAAPMLCRRIDTLEPEVRNKHQTPSSLRRLEAIWFRMAMPAVLSRTSSMAWLLFNVEELDGMAAVMLRRSWL